ncbi:MAG: DUF2214 family protein [Saprospiraceae bacterium]
MEALSNPYLILKVVHYLGIFLVVSTVFSEWLLVQPQLSRKEIKRLSLVDGGYGLGAIIVVAAGLTMWLSDIGKPAAFYDRNVYIYVKLAVFSAVGLLSIYPTIWFIKNRNGEQDEMVEVPKLIRTSLAIEVVLLLTMPLWAVLMVYG